TGIFRERLAFDAWGKRRTLTGDLSATTPAPAGAIAVTTPTPDTIDGVIDNRGYTGHEMLDQLDLVHMNGRIYDPLTARFMSADPILQDPMNAQSYNRYSYVLNNPTNLTDPTGFESQITVAGSRLIDPSIICAGGGCREWLRGAMAEASATANAASVQNTAKSGGHSPSQLRENARILRESALNPQGNWLEKILARLSQIETLAVAEYYDAWANNLENPSPENMALQMAAAYGVVGSVDPKSGGTSVSSAGPAVSNMVKRKGDGTEPHGNSRNSTKPQHRYEIVDEKNINPKTQKPDVVKPGISGGELNQDGSSRRANSQVNKLNREAGEHRYAATVTEKNIPGRAAALESERAAANQLRKDGNTLSQHVRPKPE
ncbi:MAG: hypothetical protein ING75_17715, partial [Rhodocyclaceae bacterium]|nr:hypothetical protein [Rhodocyclaceae bacterium]